MDSNLGAKEHLNKRSFVVPLLSYYFYPLLGLGMYYQGKGERTDDLGGTLCVGMTGRS